MLLRTGSSRHGHVAQPFRAAGRPSAGLKGLRHAHRLLEHEELPWPATTSRTAITRREFASRVGAAAAGLAVGGKLFDARVHAAPHVGGRILGANDRRRHRQHRHPRSGQLAQARVCEARERRDQDAVRRRRELAPERIHDERLKDIATFKPGFAQDLRRVLDDKDIERRRHRDANHWHALATIWALQAGKHV